MAVAAALLGAARVAAAQPAEEDPRIECAAAYEAAQELRLAGALSRARSSAELCANESCPAVARSACAKWALELREAQPSISLSVREGDADVSDVVVHVDGERVADSLDGRAIEVDPGKHVVRVERRGRPAVEREVVVAEGVKNRPLQLEIPPPPRPRAPRTPPRRVPAGAILLGGGAVASLAGFTLLAASGTRDLDRMRHRCGRTRSCLESDIDAARTKIIAGDVLLSVGVVSGGVAIGWTVRHLLGGQDPLPTSAVRWSVAPRAGGALGSLALTY